MLRTWAVACTHAFGSLLPRLGEEGAAQLLEPRPELRADFWRSFAQANGA